MASSGEAAQKGRVTNSIERRIGKRFKRYRFWRAMRRFQREVHLGKHIGQDLLAELVQAWGNSWSAQHEYLDHCLREARHTPGPILECEPLPSGVSQKNPMSLAPPKILKYRLIL